MIADIFSKITSAVTGMFGSIGEAINQGTALIVDPETGVTTFGTLCLIVVGVGVVYWCLRLVRSLVHLRG